MGSPIATLQGGHSSRSIYSCGKKEQHRPDGERGCEPPGVSMDWGVYTPAREIRERAGKATAVLCVVPVSDLCLESILVRFTPGTGVRRGPPWTSRNQA